MVGPNPRVYLLHIRDSCERLLECAQLRERDSIPSYILLDAACRNLEVMDEASRKISPEFRTDNPEIPWREMNDLRNVLIHNYDGTDPDMIWGIVDREIPKVLATIHRFLIDEIP